MTYKNLPVFKPFGLVYGQDINIKDVTNYFSHNFNIGILYEFEGHYLHLDFLIIIIIIIIIIIVYF
jgi:hypothetical protein